MIFHTGQIESGKVVPQIAEFGCDLVISPRSIPNPTNQTALDFHLKSGAVLCRLIDSAPLFDTDELIESLNLLKETGASHNQLMLFLVTENGDGVREVWREAARAWVKNGGVYFILDNVDDLETQLSKWEDGVLVEGVSFEKWLGQLPSISKGLAKRVVDKYGMNSLNYLTIILQGEDPVAFPPFDELTKRDIEKIGEVLNG